MPVLETERLRLRALELADADALHEVFSDPEVMRYWNHRRTPTVRRPRR